ncbi:thioredoxin 1 [Octopus bimaculoides]|uniref:Thioredoxin n=1 Tax=Octopus bimaculoides TaxID=37653 RepID=A0A0L8FZE7_OCTBM|nr:thioredoxin 1 [Octopus bimaculoides]|eukprot:XP_014785770.1 PREDICTED: thioredoxin-like [Octopus bimaculoides]
MLTITSLEQFNELLAENKDKLIIIDFFAQWCGPCKMIAPKLLAMEKDHDTVLFCKVDVDEAPDVAEDQCISAMPTFRFYKGGDKVDEVIGASEEKIKATLEKHK